MTFHVRDFVLGLACAAAVAGWFVRPEPVRALEPGEASTGEFVMTTGTGKYGGPLLFVLNTKSKVLAVYEAEGGTPATRGITWVGARKIEYDMYTTLLHDKSETSYSELKAKFLEEQSKQLTGQGDSDSNK